jgi:hypothetical protein
MLMTAAVARDWRGRHLSESPYALCLHGIRDMLGCHLGNAAAGVAERTNREDTPGTKLMFYSRYPKDARRPH